MNHPFRRQRGNQERSMRSVSVSVDGVNIDIVVDSVNEPIPFTLSETATDHAHPARLSLEPRLCKVGANGQLLDDDAAYHVAVLDQSTGLMWSAFDVHDKRLTQADAEKECKNVTLAGFTDWRLPTVRELQSLVDHSRHEPAIDTRFFPQCQSAYYWTATPCAWSSAFAWIVGFGAGYSGDVPRGYGLAFARAVRSVPAGQ